MALATNPFFRSIYSKDTGQNLACALRVVCFTGSRICFASWIISIYSASGTCSRSDALP
jgi:hypothetical protein